MDDLLKKWIPDPDALLWCRMLLNVADTWDALIDGDDPQGREKIDSAFIQALCAMPVNPFYQRWQARLHPLMCLAIRNWQTATDLEREGGQIDRECAFILRSQYIDAIVECAAICGADARSVAIEARRWVHREGFKGYLKNLKTELKED